MRSPLISWNMKKSVEIPGPPPRQDAEVVAVEPHPGGLVTLRLRCPGYVFTPGDCLAVYGPDGVTTRPYSLAGGTGDPHLELLVRRIPGGVLSEWLCGRVPGESLRISPPFGRFRPSLPVGSPKVFFATGSGIAPFLSALRSGAPAPLAAFWGVRSVLDLEGFPNHGFTACVSRGPAEGAHAGRITDLLDQAPLGGDLHYYACGLDAMIEEVSAFLDAAGVPPARVHTECFFTDQSQAR